MLVNEYLENVPNPLGIGFSYEPFNDSDFLLNLKNYIYFNHGSLQVRPTLEENIDSIPNMVLNMIECKKYQYNKLWKSTLLNYEPLENYRMEESGTDTSIENTTSNIGEQTNNGNDSKTTNNGEINIASSNSTNYGGKETTSEFVSPYDDTEARLSKKTENEYTNRKDGTTATSTTEAREDSETSNSSVTVGARTDTSTNDSTTNHTFTRSGNIGVTTSQQMLQSEREIAYFNFISIVAHDIVKLIAICIY